MRIKFLTNSPYRTKKIGEILAKEILSPTTFKKWWGTSQPKKALVIGLIGDLGGGKTTFLQGFAKGLGIKEKILSPSFVLMKKFQIHPGIRPAVPSSDGTENKFQNFYHIDCYRIQRLKEISSLKLKEIISDPKNIVTIEWADRTLEILPKGTIILKFKFIDEKKRQIQFIPQKVK